jgi:HPt (histidine-containing phosphotransfer) domain-containing protein
MAEVLDQDAIVTLLATVGDDPGFVDELVDAYLADVPQQISELHAALASGEAEGLVRPAHTLKSTSLSLGGSHVGELARAIEEQGRARSLDGVPELLQELETAQADLASALERARARGWASE